MNVKNLIATAAVLLATGAAFAAESPEPAASAGTAGAASAGAVVSASGSSQPAARDDVKEDIAGFVKDYRTPLAIQLEHYRN